MIDVALRGLRPRLVLQVPSAPSKPIGYGRTSWGYMFIKQLGPQT